MKRSDLRCKRALVIKASALGDIVHALPVLPYLKSIDRSMEIGWVVEEPFVALLQGHPMINRLHVLRTKTWRGFPLAADTRKDIGRFFADLRGQGYDLVLDLQGNSKSGLIAVATGASARYGHDRRMIREWPNLLATNHKVPPRPGDYHVTDRALRVACGALPGGVRPGAPGPLVVFDGNRSAVARRFADFGISCGKTALFHYGTVWETKLWSLASWKELAREAIQRLGLNVVLTWGSEAELAACRQISGATDGKAIIWPRCDLREIIALLDRVDLAVGGDTGLIHMAAALGTPTVSMFFATHGPRNGPRGAKDRCLQSSLKCSPCTRRKCPRIEDCRNSIGIAEVLGAMHEILGGCAAACKKQHECAPAADADAERPAPALQ